MHLLANANGCITVMWPEVSKLELRLAVLMNRR